MLQLLALLLNAALFFIGIYGFTKYGIPKDTASIILFFLLLVTPIISSISIKGRFRKGLLSLWLERKRLEEQRKIESLKRGDPH